MDIVKPNIYKQLYRNKSYQIVFHILLITQAILITYKVYLIGFTDLISQAIFFMIALNYLIWCFLREREIRIELEISMDKYVNTTMQIIDTSKKKQSC